MCLHADRPDARSAAAMRDAEGLVQVHVADVGADVAGTRQAHQRVQVGAVEIDLAAMAVDDRADIANAFLEHAVRRGIGDHQRGEVGAVLVCLGLQVVDIDVAVVRAGNDDDVACPPCGAGRIGAMRR